MTARSGRSTRQLNIPSLWRATATLLGTLQPNQAFIAPLRSGLRDASVFFGCDAKPQRLPRRRSFVNLVTNKVLCMIRSLVLTAILAFAQQACLATSIYIDLDQAVAQADVVAEVEIVEGRLAMASVGQRCGAIYEAVVRSTVKGPSVGSMISFSPFSGRGIGNRYVVLLVKAGAPGDSTYAYFKDPLIASRTPAGKEEEARAQCESGYAPLRETGWGLGTIEGKPSPHFDYRPAVSIRTLNYVSSTHFPSQCDSKMIGETCTGNTEILLDEFLKGLAMIYAGTK